jgi:hypothetical protein
MLSKRDITITISRLARFKPRNKLVNLYNVTKGVFSASSITSRTFNTKKEWFEHLVKMIALISADNAIVTAL